MRAFSSKEIEQEKLEALWAAAQWAPPSFNKQEWRYYAARGKSRAHEAPLVVVAMG